MRVAGIVGVGAPVGMIEVAGPRPLAGDEVLVEVRAAGVANWDEIVRTGGAPSSLVYSQAVRGGGLVFVSGQGPFDPASGQVVGTSIQEQTRQCLANVQAILTAAGSGIDKVLSATFILAEEDDFAGMNEEWARWFPGDPPARLPLKPASDAV